MIKAVIFDFFGVICSDEYWHFVKADRNGMSNFKELANSVNLGELTWWDFIQVVANETGHSPEEVRQLYESEHIHPGVLAYVAQLRTKYKTGLLTNAHYEFLDPIIEKADLHKFFDAIVMSSRVGAIKPSPDIYHHILKELGVQAEEAVFIDDISRHVEAAKALGMQAIVYKSFRQLQDELPAILES